MERVTFKILFYIKPSRAAKNGETPVILRVTVKEFVPKHPLILR